MTERMRAVGVFNDTTTTENALQKLDDSHFSLERVFIIARDTNKETELVGSELCESLRDRYMRTSPLLNGAFAPASAGLRPVRPSDFAPIGAAGL